MEMPQNPIENGKKAWNGGNGDNAVAMHARHGNERREGNERNERTGQFPLPCEQHANDSRGEEHNASPLPKLRRGARVRVQDLS